MLMFIGQYLKLLALLVTLIMFQCRLTLLTFSTNTVCFLLSNTSESVNGGYLPFLLNNGSILRLPTKVWNWAPSLPVFWKGRVSKSLAFNRKLSRVKRILSICFKEEWPTLEKSGRIFWLFLLRIDVTEQRITRRRLWIKRLIIKDVFLLAK